MLGPGNEEAAREALKAWPGGLQVGGGIKDGNAGEWVGWGAEKVCSEVDISPQIGACPDENESSSRSSSHRSSSPTESSP